MGFGPRLRAGRRTNLALLALLCAATLTGALSFAIGGSWVRWAVIAHGIAGLGLLSLAPWKMAISRRGLRKRRSVGVWLSVTLAVLVIITVITGLAHATGLLISLGPVSTMQVHVGAALASVPLAAWHVVARRTLPRPTDLSRRNLLRSGVLVGGTAVGYALAEVSIRAVHLPGEARRATGSYDRGSLDPQAMPVTQWLNDEVPVVDPGLWALEVIDERGVRLVGYEELLGHDSRLRAVLDCTGGWYADHVWEGALLADLLVGASAASSIEVTSRTGFRRRLPATDAGGLLLATGVGGRALSPGHGFPARLVAPGRRGFWWVKWVDRVALSDVPWWWQPPFPLA